MKKKLCYVFLAFVLMFSFTNNVFAEGFNYTFKAIPSETEVAKGGEITINVSLSSDGPLLGCGFKITSTGGELVRHFDEESESEKITTPDSKWLTTEGENILLEKSSFSSKPLGNDVSAFSVKIKANSKGSVTFSNISCSEALQGEEASHQDVVVNFDVKEETEGPGEGGVKEEDTSLSKIEVVGGSISPIFASSIYRYTVQLNSSDFGLNITATDSEFQDNIVVKDRNGNTYTDWNKINYSGDAQNQMILEVVVNNKTTYTLLVNYTQREYDNSLSSLIVGGKVVKLEKGKLSYVVKVEKDVTDVDVEAVLSDSKNFRFGASGNGPGNYTINQDGAYALIVVEPIDSSLGVESVTYSIDILRNSSGTNIPSDPGTNTDKNPETGQVSMFLMSIILLSSLVGSVILYKKNLEGYR